MDFGVRNVRKTNKNDANDAQAITEAASRPSMHFVPVKQVEQQDIQSIHRVRSRLVKNKTALINEIRGLNLEYGIAIPQGAKKVKGLLRIIIDDQENELTVSSRELMQELYEELVGLEERVAKIDKKIKLLSHVRVASKVNVTQRVIRCLITVVTQQRLCVKKYPL